MAMAPPAAFRAPGGLVHADTCAPLTAAAGRGEVRMSALVRGAYPGTPLPPRALPGVRTVGSWDAPRDQSWGLDWHRNEGVELTYLSSGRLAFATEDAPFDLRPGDLTVTRPWQVHRVGAPAVTASRLHWLILDVGVRGPDEEWRWPEWLLAGAADLRALARILRANEQPVWRVDADTGRAFERLTHAVSGSGRRRVRWIAVLVNELLLAVADMLERSEPRALPARPEGEAVVERFLAQLPERAGEPWTLDALAAACGLGRTRFAHHCMRLTNRTPIEFLTWCRLRRACTLLRERPELSVTEVALECGFGSSQYFATVFRRQTGLTPSAYAALERPPEPASPPAGRA
jgi:AraC-like DNA-binding protein